MELKNFILPLDLPTVGIISAIGFAAYILGLTIYRLFFHPLKHIPGPLLARLTYGYQIYYDAILGGVLPKKMPALHKKYGPLVRIAPDRVHINDPEFYKRIFGPREEFPKSKYYYGNLGISESIVTMQDIKAHRVLRNALNPFFTPQTAIDEHPVLVEELEKLVANLRQPSTSPKLVDLQATLGQMFVSFGTRTVFALQVSDEDAATIFGGISGWFAAFNWLISFPFIPKFALMIPDKYTGRFIPGYMTIRQMVQDCVKQCKARMKGAGEIVQYTNVFDMLQEADLGGENLNETALLHEAIELLAGGVLPPNTASVYAVYFLLTYPQVLLAMKEELAHVPKNGDGIPMFDHLSDVPYTAAIVKETLRLRPTAGPGFLPRTVGPQGVYIGDKFIPGGTNISTGLYIVGTNPTIFKNPLAFDPGRWLGEEGAELDDWFVAFSKGPRMCLGKHIAMLSIASTIAALFTNFEFSLHETDDQTMEWQDQTLMINKKNLKVFVKPLPPSKVPSDDDIASKLEKGISLSPVVPDADSVILPDLFVSWAATPVKLNPHYKTIAPQAEEWFGKICSHDAQEHAKYLKADFGYFAGTWVPDADAASLWTAIDYCNWVWAFDDPFDEGSMKYRPDLIEREGAKLMSIMSDNPPEFTPENHPVLHVFQLIWKRVVAKGTKNVQDRFRMHQKDFMRQILEQSDPKVFETYTDLESFVSMHRESVGSKPLLPLIESCYGIDIPAVVFEDPGIQRIIDLQAELILLANDLYSYAREAAGEHYDGHNVLHVLRRGGMTQQEASDAVGEATVARYNEWDDVVEKLPSWGPETDEMVAKYIEMSRITVVSNIEWSFESMRYFGSKNKEVRKTRRIAAIPFVG